jgi:hypothetical protein
MALQCADTLDTSKLQQHSCKQRHCTYTYDEFYTIVLKHTYLVFWRREVKANSFQHSLAARVILNERPVSPYTSQAVS